MLSHIRMKCVSIYNEFKYIITSYCVKLKTVKTKLKTVLKDQMGTRNVKGFTYKTLHNSNHLYKVGLSLSGYFVHFIDCRSQVIDHSSHQHCFQQEQFSVKKL